MRRYRRIIVILVAAVVLLAALAGGAWALAGDRVPTSEGQPRAEAAVQPAAAGTSRTILVKGAVVPVRHAALSMAAGGIVAELLAKEGEFAHVKMPSGEVRLFKQECLATIGQVGNIEHENISIGKAGRTRWMGKKPHVRGVAMNPVDHPMGGGEGKSSGGRHPCSPWGQLSKGLKTGNRKRAAKLIVKKRDKK